MKKLEKFEDYQSLLYHRELGIVKLKYADFDFTDLPPAYYKATVEQFNKSDEQEVFYKTKNGEEKTAIVKKQDLWEPGDSEERMKKKMNDPNLGQYYSETQVCILEVMNLCERYEKGKVKLNKEERKKFDIEL